MTALEARAVGRELTRAVIKIKAEANAEIIALHESAKKKVGGEFFYIIKEALEKTATN